MSVEVQLSKHWPGGAHIDAAFASDASTLALFGRSGSGKSTVVNVLAGILRPDTGRIVIDGVVLFDAARRINVPIEARGVGYVFQEGLLFPHLTVQQNLLYGARRAGTRSMAMQQVVALLGIAALLGRKPATLSGGEKQRVAIGRALLSNPRLLLMDEPLASLDAARRSEILGLIERVRDELKVRIVYVSHSVGEVTRLADEVVLMNGGQVVAHGAVEDIFNRADLRPHTGRFEGGALIEAKAIAQDAHYGLTTFFFGDGGILVAPGLDVPIGARVRMRIRARDLTLATSRPQGLSIRNVLPGEVTAIEAGAGPIAEVRVRVAGKEWPARISRLSVDEMGLVAGVRVYVLVKAIAFDKRSMGFTT